MNAFLCARYAVQNGRKDKSYIVMNVLNGFRLKLDKCVTWEGLVIDDIQGKTLSK